MGQPAPKMCHTQEIAFDGPSAEEWTAIDEWSEDKTVPAGFSSNFVQRLPHDCRLCCKPSDSQVEEVLVVHHEALQRVNFLLRHDELQSCEAPSIPECVTAMRRAKIQRQLKDYKAQGVVPLPRLPDVTAGERPHVAMESQDDDDPSDVEEDRTQEQDFSGESHPLAHFELRLRSGILACLPFPTPLDSYVTALGEDPVAGFVMLRLETVDPPTLLVSGAPLVPDSGLRISALDVECIVDGFDMAAEHDGKRRPDPAAAASPNTSRGSDQRGSGWHIEECAGYLRLPPIIFDDVCSESEAGQPFPMVPSRLLFRNRQDARDFFDWQRDKERSESLK